MTVTFFSAKLRLSRAKEHIIDLDKRIKAFFDTKPYVPTLETDPDGFQELHKVKFTKPFPDDFAIVAADAVDNLRSALDHAWYAIAVASGAIKSGGKAYFPVYDSAIEFETKFVRKIKRGCQIFPQDILTLLMQFKPYKGGNNLLWALNRVCATNKHRMLAPTCITTFTGIDYVKCVGKGKADIIRPYWDRGKNEIIYFIGDTRNQIKYHYYLSFGVAFNEVEIISGKLAVAILNDMTSMVENILADLERMARKLGFI